MICMVEVVIIKIARVFPRKTKASPDDGLAFFTPPPRDLPNIDEVHISVAFTYDMPKATQLAENWIKTGLTVRMGGPAFNAPGGDFVPGMYLKKGYVIFDLSASGNSAQEIAKELYVRNIPTPGEYKAGQGMKGYDISRCHHMWQRSSVLRILYDERYIGTYIMGKRAVNEVGSNRVHLKDESEWFKIPDHHPGIVDKEVFAQVQDGIKRMKSSPRMQKKYPLRGKVFCGCCSHAMYRMKKDPEYSCRFTAISDSFPCRGLAIRERELESVLFEIMSKQATVILNIDTVQSLDELTAKMAERVSYETQIEDCYAHKMNIYERYMLKEIGLDIYQRENAVFDAKLKDLQRLHSGAAAITKQMLMDKEEKANLLSLARDVAAESTLTQKLTDALIEKVSIFPGNQIEIVWRVKAFA